MLELLLVGAGPHNLCLLLRLLEPLGAPVDVLRRPPSSKREVERRAHKQRCCKEYRAALKAWLEANVAVVDDRGQWMHRWCTQFSGLQIPFLRSNSALHVDPHDTYSLTHFADSAKREREVQALRHIGKTGAFHGPFHTPGSALFEDHCADCVDRYCVEGVVRKGKVVHLEPVLGDDGRALYTRATLACGAVLEARRVVLGIGSTNLQRLPPFAADAAAAAPAGRVAHAWELAEAAGGQLRGDIGGSPADGSPQQWSGGSGSSSDGSIEVGGAFGTPRSTSSGEESDDESSDGLEGSISNSGSSRGGSTSSSDGDTRSRAASRRGGLGRSAAYAAAPRPAPSAGAALAAAGMVAPGEHVVVVGGGLTSAHLAGLAAAGGASRVTLLLRGPLRIKQASVAAARRLCAFCHFDVDIEFMGRLRGEALADYRRRRGGEARLAALKRALQGGSITPEAWAALEPLRRAGVLAVHEHVSVAGAEWDAETGRVAVWSEDGAMELAADRLWLATGSLVDASREPLLAQLLRALPVALHGGLPAVQPDLEWAPGSSIYVLGAYAALQLGPGALNLAGAKTASALVVGALAGGGRSGSGSSGSGSGSGSGACGQGEGGWLADLRALQSRFLLPCGGARAAA